VSWKTEGELVHGVMSNDVTFTLDTTTSTTTYSNDIQITDGKPVKIKDLPNGFELFSNGNSKHVISPYGHFLIGPVDAVDVWVDDDDTVICVDDRGMRYEIDTTTNYCKFQIQGGNGVKWVTRNERGRLEDVPEPKD
jgi:uncharacterized lipoprotein YajG